MNATEGRICEGSREDLVRMLALESVRNRARHRGRRSGDSGDRSAPDARLLRHPELPAAHLRAGRAADFEPPAEYPQQALTSTTTHDLATIAGFWTGEDIEARLRAGTIDNDSYDLQTGDRAQDKQHLLDALFQVGLMPEDYERDAARIPELPETALRHGGFSRGTPSSCG